MSARVIGGGAAALAVAALLVPASVSSVQQRPSFGATVARVRVDVIVTDEEGRFVADLRPDELVLYEDGAEQQILSTQIVDLAAGTVTEFRRAAPSGADAAANFDTRPVSSVTSGEFGALIYLVDLPGLDRKNKDRFAEAWLRLLDESEPHGIPRAVYMIDQVGRLRELTPLTLSLEALRDAVVAVRDAPLTRPGLRHRLLRVAADVVAADAADFVDPSANDLNEIRILETQERARTRATFELLTQFCSALSARRGRTALVWVTSGVQLTEGGPGTALAVAYMEISDPEFNAGTVDRSRRTGSSLFSYLSIDSDLTGLQEALHQAANSANVSIYTIDPTPRADYRSLATDMRVRGPGLSDLLNSSIVQSSLEGLQDALWQAAAETGGQAAIGATDLGEALRNVVEDSSRFYLLSYAPPAPHGDGEFHSISVEVRRPGVRVRQRSGYVDYAPEVRDARALGAALMLPGAAKGLPVDARFFRGWSAQGEPVVKLVIALEQSLAQQQIGLPENAFHQIHAAALDSDGRLVDELNLQMSPPGGLSRKVRSGERPTVYVHEWALPPGSYDVRVAVRDGVSGNIGATRLDVEIPASPEAWSASDLMLAVTDGEGPPLPLTSNTVLSDESLYTYVEVAGGTDPVITGQLFRGDDTQPFAPLPETPLVKDSSGIHRGALRLRNLPAGDYTLEFVVIDRTAGEQRTYRARLQVLPSLSGSRGRH